MPRGGVCGAVDLRLEVEDVSRSGLPFSACLPRSCWEGGLFEDPLPLDAWLKGRSEFRGAEWGLLPPDLLDRKARPPRSAGSCTESSRMFEHQLSASMQSLNAPARIPTHHE